MKYYQVSYIFENGTGHGTYKTEDGFNLGTVVNNLRIRKRNGRLTTEQISKLDMLGFIWDFGVGQKGNQYTN